VVFPPHEVLETGKLIQESKLPLLIKEADSPLLNKEGKLTLLVKEGKLTLLIIEVKENVNCNCRETW